MLNEPKREWDKWDKITAIIIIALGIVCFVVIFLRTTGGHTTGGAIGIVHLMPGAAIR